MRERSPAGRALGGYLGRKHQTSFVFYSVNPLKLCRLVCSGVARRPYLALGDSVSFGFISNAGFEYVNPENFVGFPDYVGQALKFGSSNAACPGEASDSFLSSTAPDDGCRFYRSQAPLHVSYHSTQLDFAISFLKSHPNTKLVSVGLGANDVLLLRAQRAGDPTFISLELPQVLAAVETNLATILGDLRAAGYKGIVVVVNYYSVDYSDVNGTAITAALTRHSQRLLRHRPVLLLPTSSLLFKRSLEPLAVTRAMWDY